MPTPAPSSVPVEPESRAPQSALQGNLPPHRTCPAVEDANGGPQAGQCGRLVGVIRCGLPVRLQADKYVAPAWPALEDFEHGGDRAGRLFILQDIQQAVAR